MKSSFKFVLAIAVAAIAVSVCGVVGVMIYRTTPEYSLSQAEKYITGYNYRKAIPQLEKYLLEVPTDEDGWIKLAETYNFLGKPEMAKNALMRASNSTDSEKIARKLTELDTTGTIVPTEIPVAPVTAEEDDGTPEDVPETEAEKAARMLENVVNNGAEPDMAMMKKITELSICINGEKYIVYDDERVDLNINKQVPDISFMKYCSETEVLNLSVNSIDDISPLINLVKLKRLKLSYNRISDVTPLTRLTNLELLWLEGNNISDISPIAGLKNLKELNVSKNKIRDISVLAELKGLFVLAIGNNPVEDYSCLNELPALQVKDIEIPQTTTVADTYYVPPTTTAPEATEEIHGYSASEIAKMLEKHINDGKTLDKDMCAEITGFKASNTDSKKCVVYCSGDSAEFSLDDVLSDISFIKHFTNITELNLSNNDIVDISPLKNLKKLTALNIEENQILSISALGDLTNLKDLRMGGNSVTKLAPLKSLVNLTRLEIKDCGRITDISVTGNLTKLKRLVITGGDISDISVVKKLKKLQHLNLSSNRISDISSLSKLTNLEYLNLGGNVIVDITSIESLTGLTELDLSYNGLSSVSSLKKFKNLKTLNIVHNNINRSYITTLKQALPNCKIYTDYD